VKQALFAYVNDTLIRYWNQPVLNNEGKVSCSRKQRQPLMWLELMIDEHLTFMSQTCNSLRHTRVIICTSLTLLLYTLVTTYFLF